MHQISIVVPLYNEEGNVVELHREIVEICERNQYVYEIILIDDGSSDETVKRAKSLSPVKVIELRRNFGQTAAMDVGIKAAQYPYIVTMDGDRQNDPDDIPKLIQHLEKHDLDVVSGWRKNRKDPFMKRFVSRGANFLRSVLVDDGINDSGCSLKVYKKECFETLSLYGEMHRFIPALLKIKGFKIGEVVVNHRARTAGVTKYNWKRTVKGFIDMIAVWFWNKYAMRPLHLLGGIGIVMILLSVCCMGVAFVLFLQGQDISDTAWPILTALLFLSGLNMFVGGVLADILVKGYYEGKGESYYSVKEISIN